MSQTDLIVPIQLHALVYNLGVQESQPFHRWNPTFKKMLQEQAPAEPEASPAPPLADLEDKFGVYLQWQLPEAIATGHVDPESGETTFPLMPNRWLIVRYANGSNGRRQAAGWVVQSDYLRSEYDVPPSPGRSTHFLNPRGPGAPFLDFIGRWHQLGPHEPWREPRPRDPELSQPFLTAIGPGLPAFAAFEPYHRNVLSFYDDLGDLREDENLPPEDSTFSYLAVGWYSERDIDLLTRAADIPGLLPPDADGPEDVLKALGWALPEGTDGQELTDSRYVGSALGVTWRRTQAPPPEMPAVGRVKVAAGHSTDDAAEALAEQQTGSLRTASLLKALYHGVIDTLESADGGCEVADATRSTWFAGRNGGYAWQIVDRPGAGDAPARHLRAEEPAWLDTLNANQAAYDALEPELRRSQQRFWTLSWLHGLPEHERPEGFAAQAWEHIRPDKPGNLADDARKLHDRAEALLKAIPHGSTPEALQAAIDDFAAGNGLPDHLELKRIAHEPFHQPADPVILIEGSGARQPLGRDPDNPLPCRLLNGLLREVMIGSDWVPVPGEYALPNLGGDIPPMCEQLVPEFALLDRAVMTPGSGAGPTALHTILSGSDGEYVRGSLAEYTAVWKQPWLPMYVQWDLRYSPVPYRTADTDNWTFNGTDYDWAGSGSQVGSEEDARQRAFRGRSFLAPTTVYVLRSQIRRYLQTFPERETAGLRELARDCEKIDVLSQSLDGFNDWLLRQDGAARLVPDAATAHLTGDGSVVPRPGSPARTGEPEDTFQPVRAGQFFFMDLRIIDRFGRVYDIVADNDHRPEQFPLLRAASVTPTEGTELYPHLRGGQRFVQLPPRIFQESRVRLEAVKARDGARYAGGPQAADAERGPVAGWLMLNYLDKTLLVYAPDGTGLGELRVIHNEDGQKETAWNPLPHAPYPDPEAFEAAYPHLARWVIPLRGENTGRFEDLLETIDGALDSIDSPHAEDDRTVARLVGRPVALIRAGLGVDLKGPPLTDSSWENVLSPPEEDYPTYRWPIRLGDADRLSDGLIGYYATNGEPGDEISYDRLHAVDPLGDSGYTVPIGKGEGLAMPARTTCQEPLTHHLTLLADPHVPVHATTGILPVVSLALPADLVHQALLRIRASFRLNPLLAPVRQTAPQEQDVPLPPGLVMPQPASWHGTWTWAEPSRLNGDGDVPQWSETVIAPADTRFHPDDPAPEARAGYLQLDPTRPE